MQKCIFPMEVMRVTQGELTAGSHLGSLAMDFGGRDGGSDRLYAPCDMIVKRCRSGANGEMYLQSLQPVEFADGTSDYLVLLCLHDAAFNKKVGEIVRQGDYFYDEGGLGANDPNKFATHVHIEVSKGSRTLFNQIKNSFGTYVIKNQAHLYDIFYITDNTVVLNNGGYVWKKITANTKNKYESFCEELKKLLTKYDI